MSRLHDPEGQIVPRDAGRLGSRRHNKAGMAPLLAALAAAPLILGGPTAAQQVIVDRGAEVYAGEVDVAVNKSVVLRTAQAIRDILVGNPEIADVIPLTDRSVYVLGKQIGSTSLSIYGPNRQIVSVMDLNVGYDTEALKRRLFELMPGEPIEVRTVGDAIILSGEVSSPARLQMALDVAERLAPDKVTNLVGIAGSQQVMLEVQIAEVTRSAIRQLGVNFDAATIVDNHAIDLATGALMTGIINPEAFGSLGYSLARGDFGLDALIEALERRGVLRVLAEPNLIAKSGQTARFLAGGEFPIPVAASNEEGTLEITVEFKEFGVSLAFTPVVLGDGSIHLEVAPEVSAIDPNTSVTLENIVIPGLTTRRASTVVELRDGQSFAIAGLISSDFTSTIRQLPGLGEVPILSALFRSSSFQREETELVILVTPHLVRPANPGELALPTDTVTAAHPLSTLFLGRLETRTERANALLQQGGGPDGDVGHVVQ